MDTAALVSFDIDNGQRLIDAMEKASIGPEVALWAVLPQYEDWRLVVASSRLEQYSRVGGYAHISEAMRAANIPFLSAPVVYLREMTDPFIVELRSLFSSVDDTYGMRLGGQKFGDQYIEDGFVYRIR
jgi:hypothetical protein